ncbi:hypothetical protein C10C_0511 [Chlamydia serpentis]|uniref:Uncharacterized protein n=1 Tax=Chlamydia serpentis TaxID=1967782 RepID=A0A2R8FBH5_9CHLA|nr:hypothetical protein [Chlamydia serpentis]SPN73672.1 hypothetical protein C10C_0511 [Chlamydia serpentis]
MPSIILRLLLIFLPLSVVFPVSGSEASFWENRLYLTILGTPFIDIILEIDQNFIAQCGLETGVIFPTDSSKIQEIFLKYKEQFPKTRVCFKRKEPLNLSPYRLSNLGIRSMRNGENYTEEMINKENGPALQQPKYLRLVLRCPNAPDTLLYSKEGEQAIGTMPQLLKQGYTLIDSRVAFYGDSMEKFLKETKKNDNYTLFDLSDSEIVSEFLGRFWTLLDHVQVLFLSGDSAKILSGIPDLAIAKRLLSRIVPLLFIYTNNSIHIIEAGKESSFSYNQDLTDHIAGFLFGYINRGSTEYCFNCAQSLLGEA